ncbi:MAG: HAMP domain-containing histidine kinase [Propionibacteriaceae bacterium]|jgi:signal transduction histidine kinase|nr:HAMP domain-containing histidine kinase [Propionibacteriaceae bacterium]
MSPDELSTDDASRVEVIDDTEKRPFSLSLRAKIMLAISTMLVLTLILTLVISTMIQTRIEEDHIRDTLQEEIDEFNQIWGPGVHPLTKKDYTNVREILMTSMDLNIPGTDEVFMIFVDHEQLDIDPERAEGLKDNLALLRTVSDPALADTKEVHVYTDDEVGTVWFRSVSVTMPDSDDVGIWVALVELDRIFASQANFGETIALVIVGMIIVSLIAGWFIVGRLVAPLHELTKTAGKIYEEDINHRVEVHGNDDIARMGLSFNEMLDRLRDSFEIQRRFLDDAGHELRTPLTVMKGHLDILEIDDPSDVAATRDILLDEVARMRRITDDLIILAKSNRTDFVIPQPTDLRALITDLASNCSALGGEWTIDLRGIGLGPDGQPLLVDADVQRLTQAILQMAENAVKYGGGRSGHYDIGASVNQHEAAIWVSDHGDGLPEEERKRIFERFIRGSNSYGKPGSGLGLSIVHAIAAGHGGGAIARSTDGGGLTVVMHWTPHIVEDDANTPLS